MRTVEGATVERDVPGRDGDLAALIAACEAIARGSGGGRTVFVSGDAGSGRPELLLRLAPTELLPRRPGARWDRESRATGRCCSARTRRAGRLGDDPRALREARELLVCAALEGRRFTAEGVAAALSRNRDEVNDVLDERLARDADHPLELVVEDGSVEVDDETGRRTLWR